MAKIKGPNEVIVCNMKTGRRGIRVDAKTAALHVLSSKGVIRYQDEVDAELKNTTIIHVTDGKKTLPITEALLKHFVDAGFKKVDTSKMEKEEDPVAKVLFKQKEGKKKKDDDVGNISIDDDDIESLSSADPEV